MVSEEQAIVKRISAEKKKEAKEEETRIQKEKETKEKELELLRTSGMSAMEIEKVVKELDSMSNIGTKYGIPQEGVYFLKANFR